MNIDDMNIGENFDFFECEIVRVEPVNSYEKDGDLRKVQNLIVKDSIGKEIMLVLWGSQTHEKLGWSAGEKLLLVNGFTKSYNGQKQISTGKIGVITRAKPVVIIPAVVDKKKTKKVK